MLACLSKRDGTELTIISRAAFWRTAQRIEKDYGYDLLCFTYDKQGYAEPDLFFVQLKAAGSLQAIGSDYVFDLDIRDYNLWIREEMPVILVLFDASRRRAYWLHIQGYFDTSAARQPKKGTKTIRIQVPMRQAVSRRAIATMRTLKEEACRDPKGG